MAERSPQAEMPFLDHLEELRWRLLYSLLALVVGTAIGWFLVNQIDILEILKRPIAPYLPDGRLTFTSPTEPFFLTFKLAAGVGCVLASPIVLYHAWAFLAPALYPREKKMIVPALSVGVLLFSAGVVAAYRWVLPAALQVLFSFQREDLSALITIDRYFGFAIPLVLAFGAVTELPLVIALLAALGLVTPRFLARNRRYAIVVAAFGAALLTPPDVVSMMMMMVPLLLLYEVSILLAWLIHRRRARAAAAAAGPGGTAGLVVLFLLAGAGGLAGQQRPAPQRQAPRDTTRRPMTAADSVRAGQAIDTATARKLGLPTGPKRSFPASDPVLDSLRRLSGFTATRYVADSLMVLGDSQVIVLRGDAFIEREGTQLEADSVRYKETACRLDAMGTPRLFETTSVMVGEAMRYDTCVRRGTVTEALTNFDQGGTTWFMRGDLAVDSGSTRLYGSHSDVTSCDLPEAHYHFGAGEVKWLNKSVMVARPAVLYVRDVPILWMPFIFQDIRSGRRSGMLVPRFGLSELVRTSPDYTRHVTNLGYYFAISDYVDLLGSFDWFSGDNVKFRAQTRYRVLNRFFQGGVSFLRVNELDTRATSTRIGWIHQQRFSSRTSFSANIDYATDTRVVQQNSINPFLASSTLNSAVNFDKRFAWGALNLGGRYTQNLANDQATANFPELRLTPSPVNIGSSVTWSPGFSFTNNKTYRNPGGTIAIPGDTAHPVTFDARVSTINFQTPLRVGRWNWSNSFSVVDQVSSQRKVFVDTATGAITTFGTTFETAVDWQTGINLPQLFTGTWKVQPGVSIVNTTTAGPFLLRNQFSGGQFVQQGKRPQFSLGVRPTFFGFFPGFGPLARIRHAFSPSVDYRYAPAAKVPDEYAQVLEASGRGLTARTDPQQTISVQLNQNFEAKFKLPEGDTTGAERARKVRLLSINTSSMSYNFEAAKEPGRSGWQDQTLTNTFASDLLPNFSLSLRHNLWDGPVGFDTTAFDPFLENVSATFSIGAPTVRAVLSIFGLGGTRPPPIEEQAYVDTAGQAGLIRGTPRDMNLPIGGMQPGAFENAPGGGRAFTLGVQYSSTRVRGDTTAASLGGQRNLNLNLGFSPTRNWSVSWTTNYDLDTQRFGQHYLRFERNLHEWQASFAFSRSPNGNVAFNFAISLTHLPDIKFDYDQQTY